MTIHWARTGETPQYIKQKTTEMHEFLRARTYYTSQRWRHEFERYFDKRDCLSWKWNLSLSARKSLSYGYWGVRTAYLHNSRENHFERTGDYRCKQPKLDWKLTPTLHSAV